MTHARANDINFTSAKKMKSDLDASIDVFSDSPEVRNIYEPKIEQKRIPAPTEKEMNSFFAELKHV